MYHYPGSGGAGFYGYPQGSGGSGFYGYPPGSGGAGSSGYPHGSWGGGSSKASSSDVDLVEYNESHASSLFNALQMDREHVTEPFRSLYSSVDDTQSMHEAILSVMESTRAVKRTGTVLYNGLPVGTVVAKLPTGRPSGGVKISSAWIGKQYAGQGIMSALIPKIIGIAKHYNVPHMDARIHDTNRAVLSLVPKVGAKLIEERTGSAIYRLDLAGTPREPEPEPESEPEYEPEYETRPPRKPPKKKGSLAGRILKSLFID